MREAGHHGARWPGHHPSPPQRVAAAGQESEARPKSTRATFPVHQRSATPPIYCWESLEIFPRFLHEYRRVLVLTEHPDDAVPRAKAFAA